MAMGNMRRKIGKDCACSSQDMLAGRQTHTQTYSSQHSASAPMGEVTISLEFTMGGHGCIISLNMPLCVL